MILINIPLIDGAPLPFFEQQTVLDAVTYTLRFRWNNREGAWYLSILDEASETMLLADMKIVVPWPLNAYRSGNPMPGALIAFDSEGLDQDPALTDLGIRVKLYYVTGADLGR